MKTRGLEENDCSLDVSVTIFALCLRADVVALLDVRFLAGVIYLQEGSIKPGQYLIVSMGCGSNFTDCRAVEHTSLL